MIHVKQLLACFEQMYAEHWAYQLGSAKKGCVDCSGAFVYAYQQLRGPSIAHGSNTIFRTAIGETQSTPRAGYAAFKIRYDAGEPKKYWADGLGNAYHIGLVAADGKHVLNAKGQQYGFCLDNAVGWTCFAPLLAVDYGEETGGEEDMQANATVETASGNLNVREAPNTSARVVSKFPKGTRVEIIRDEGEWLYVRHTNITGYVSAQYIRKDSEESPGNTAPVEGITVVVTDVNGNHFRHENVEKIEFE